jgi:murein DD-endopeptidase MepM/ murein hydrolase activator NlpD
MIGTFNKNIQNQMSANSKQLSLQVGKIQSGIARKQQAQRIARLEASRETQTLPPSSSGFIDPTQGAGKLTSNFTAKRKSGIHGAIDVGADAGTPVLASQTGKVLSVDYHDSGFGHVVAIQHDNGLQTSYAHLRERPNLKPGQTVKQGQRIGSVGNTGYSTGNHLDFRIGKRLYQNGTWNFAKDADVIDPLTVIDFKQPRSWLD